MGSNFGLSGRSSQSCASCWASRWYSFLNWHQWVSQVLKAAGGACLATVEQWNNMVRVVPVRHKEWALRGCWGHWLGRPFCPCKSACFPSDRIFCPFHWPGPLGRPFLAGNGQQLLPMQQPPALRGKRQYC